MKSRRLLASMFAACLLVSLHANFGFAQGGGGAGGGGAGGGGAGAGGGGDSSGGIGASGGIGTGTTGGTTQGQTAVTVQTITSGTGSATSNPSNSNPFVSSYADVLTWGLPSKYATTFGPLAKPTVTFGKGIYTTTTNTASTATAAATAAQATGFSTVGQPRNPQYTTTLSPDIPFVTHTPTALLSDVRGVIARSSKLKSKNSIQVNVDGNLVVLTGQVNNARERMLAESMVSMTAGVRSVDNQLTVAQNK